MPEGRYAAADIEVLEGAEAIRRRPSLYAGDVGSAETVAQLTLEPLCFALDESTGGPATEVTVELHADGSAEVANDGPGLPLGGRPGVSRTFIEIIMTLRAGCRAEKSEELHKHWCGVGIAVTCALSEWCVVTVKREGGVWTQRFEKGVAVGPLQRNGDTTSTATSVRFLPDRSI